MSSSIVLAAIAKPSNPIDLTALTSPNGSTYDPIQGADGSDWAVYRERTLENLKREGGGQCAWTWFSDTGVALTGGGLALWALPTWNSNDDINGNGQTLNATNFYVGFTDALGINLGLRWTLRSTRELKTFRALGATNAGTYVVKASLDDGSYPDQILTFTTDADHCFECKYRGKATTGLMTIEIRRTVASGSGPWFQYNMAYILPPKPALLPRTLVGV